MGAHNACVFHGERCRREAIVIIPLIAGAGPMLAFYCFHIMCYTKLSLLTLKENRNQ